MDDNGKGFDTDNYSEDSNLNLRLIKDRAEILGGSFLVDSTLGKGTRVTMMIPIE